MYKIMKSIFIRKGKPMGHLEEYKIKNSMKEIGILQESESEKWEIQIEGTAKSIPQRQYIKKCAITQYLNNIQQKNKMAVFLGTAI